MTPEEKFNRDVWWVLQQLEYLRISSRKGGNTTFIITVRPIIGDDTLPPQNQENVLLKAEEWGAIKITDQEVRQDTYGKDFIYTLEFRQPKFNELYKKYRNACDINSYANVCQDIDVNNLTEHKNQRLPEFYHVEPPSQSDTLENTDVQSEHHHIVKKPIFQYNTASGIGKNGVTDFRLTISSPEHALFTTAWKMQGDRVERTNAAKLAGGAFTDEELQKPDPAQILDALGGGKARKKDSREVTITSKINAVVKNIRRKTSLTPQTLIMNGGNIILHFHTF